MYRYKKPPQWAVNNITYMYMPNLKNIYKYYSCLASSLKTNTPKSVKTSLL